MAIQRRPYRDASDLERLQAFNAEAARVTDGCGYLHPGDIAHRLFNGNRWFDPTEMMTLWEDDRELVAWVLVQPKHEGYDAQVRPDMREGEFESAVYAWAEDETRRLMDHHGVVPDELINWAYRCDTRRAAILADTGWSLHPNPPEVLNRRTLDEIADPVLPDGYRIRSVRGPEEAAAVADAHSGSLGSQWTPQLMEQLMASAGYDPRRELVVEASGGELAALTIIWFDELNRTGLFEPVGTHAEHRRLGLASALLRQGMKVMRDAGMEYATVVNTGTNEASRDLYLSNGFEPWHEIDWYTKPFAPPGS